MQGEEKAGRRPLGLVEYLFAELRQAFQDIRQKFVEEGWFGRVVTAAPVVEMDRAQIEGLKPEGKPPVGEDLDVLDRLARNPTFDDIWAPRERSDADREQERAHEIDIDR
ncbi:MAG: hypothetical protein ACRD9W_12785 [Terriglobia bacterium]